MASFQRLVVAVEVHLELVGAVAQVDLGVEVVELVDSPASVVGCGSFLPYSVDSPDGGVLTPVFALH